MKAQNFQDPSAQMKRAMFQALAIGAVAVVSDIPSESQDGAIRPPGQAGPDGA